MVFLLALLTVVYTGCAGTAKMDGLENDPRTVDVENPPDTDLPSTSNFKASGITIGCPSDAAITEKDLTFSCKSPMIAVDAKADVKAFEGADAAGELASFEVRSLAGAGEDTSVLVEGFGGKWLRTSLNIEHKIYFVAVNSETKYVVSIVAEFESVEPLADVVVSNDAGKVSFATLCTERPEICHYSTVDADHGYTTMDDDGETLPPGGQYNVLNGETHENLEAWAPCQNGECGTSIPDVTSSVGPIKPLSSH